MIAGIVSKSLLKWGSWYQRLMLLHESRDIGGIGGIRGIRDTRDIRDIRGTRGIRGIGESGGDPVFIFHDPVTDRSEVENELQSHVSRIGTHETPYLGLWLT